MRTVAVVLVLLLGLAAVPLSSANECVNDAARAQVCQTVDARRPATPPNVPAAPQSPYWGTYYLFVGAAACATGPSTNACRGSPAAPGSGIPHPTQEDTSIGPAPVMGVLWVESNGKGGLQRFKLGGDAPDRTILV